MKKILFSFAMAFAISGAYAQSNVNLNGKFNNGDSKFGGNGTLEPTLL